MHRLPTWVSPPGLLGQRGFSSQVDHRRSTTGRGGPPVHRGEILPSCKLTARRGWHTLTWSHPHPLVITNTRRLFQDSPGKRDQILEGAQLDERQTFMDARRLPCPEWLKASTLGCLCSLRETQYCDERTSQGQDPGGGAYRVSTGRTEPTVQDSSVYM